MKDEYCAECGMAVGANEYHPFTACVLFMYQRDSKFVRLNLQAVIDWARSQIRPLRRAARGKRARGKK